jgi:hypothetical protein
MLDFSSFKNEGQKLIALFLFYFPEPLQKKQICEELVINVINESTFRKNIKYLLEIGYIEKFQNKYGITLYGITLYRSSRQNAESEKE